MPYILPIEWHPIVVHFPIALLATSVGLDFLAAIMRRWSIADAAMWCLVIGVPGLLVAAASGNVGEHAINRAAIGNTLEMHQAFAFATGVVFATLLLVRLVWYAPRLLSTMQPTMPELATGIGRPLRAVFPLLYAGRTPRLLVFAYLVGNLVGLALLITTGYLGGALVYHYHAVPSSLMGR